MLRFVLSRLGQSLLSIVGIVILVFFLARLTGSPALQYLPEGASPQLIAQFNQEYGFDRPLWQQFITFVNGVAHFDFGPSLLFGGSPAMSVVLDRYPATVKLAAYTMVIAVLVGVAIGVVSATKPESFIGQSSRLGSLIGISVPDFWVAITGITVFAVYLGVLPTSGSGPDIRYWILPVATLALRPIGILVQVVRSSMMEVLHSDYIKIARGKGVPETAVLYKHGLRNAAIPILTVAGTLTASIINGALIVESVFGWPGVGNLMVEAIKGRDFALIQAVIIVTAAAIVVLNLVLDVLYMWLNPQIHYS
jgi:peptide/nickel transport system permease protein